MSVHDFLAILPIVVVAGFAIVVMLGTAFRLGPRFALGATLVGFAAALASIAPAWAVSPRQVTPLLVVDGQTLLFAGLFLASSLALTMLSYEYLQRRGVKCEEFYILSLLAVTGALVLASSTHLASFFLGLEILTVSLYAMVAYARDEALGVEAAAKYLILGGASSAFLLFGMALVYADTGSMELSRIVTRVAESQTGSLAVAGLAMLVVSIGFKMALVPFHLWAADVYQGAPAPVAAFIATVSKGAIVSLVLRYFTPLAALADPLWVIFVLASIASMFTGNLLALFQTNVKRILAYSSIAHMGYLLIAFVAGGTRAAYAVSFYLVAYFVTTLGAFGVITVLSTPSRDADSMNDYESLAWRRPWLAGVFTAMLLSLAGIPLTAGFIGKFWIFFAGLQAKLWPLALILAVNSAIGLFYYLRIIIAMYKPLPEGAAPAPAVRPAVLSAAVLAPAALCILTLALIALGVYPGPLMDLIQAAIKAVF